MFSNASLPDMLLILSPNRKKKRLDVRYTALYHVVNKLTENIVKNDYGIYFWYFLKTSLLLPKILLVAFLLSDYFI